MFAPTSSSPPYYPSYSPPAPAALSSLFDQHAFLPQHGTGAWNETWRIQHGTYFTDRSDSVFAPRDASSSVSASRSLSSLRRAVASSARMNDVSTGSSAGVGNSGLDAIQLGGGGAGGGGWTNGATSAADPLSPRSLSASASSRLIYTDPLAYSAAAERNNAPLLSLFPTLPEDLKLKLRNTPFMHYLYEGMCCIDIGRLDEEWFDLAMMYLSRVNKMHTLYLIDSWHMHPRITSPSCFKSRSRGHPSRSGGSLGGGGGSVASSNLYASSLRSSMTRFPDERAILPRLESAIMSFLARNNNSLVHVELSGLWLPNWDDVLTSVGNMPHLQRLHISDVDLGDAGLATLLPFLKKSLPVLSHLTVRGCGLSSASGEALASVVKLQTGRRDMVHFENTMRASGRAGLSNLPLPAPASSLLLSHEAGAYPGLQSLDLSSNNLGDRGVVHLSQALAPEKYLRALDLSDNGAGVEAVRAVVAMLEENRSIMYVHIQGERSKRRHPSIPEDAKPRRMHQGGGQYSQSQHQRDANYPLHAATAAQSTSAQRLLDECDAHKEKRNKRMLIMFHQQNLEMERFVTGQPSASARGDAPPAVPASDVFRKFFSPIYSREPKGGSAFGTMALPRSPESPRRARQSSPARKRGSRSSSVDLSARVLSPAIRALRRERIDSASKKKMKSNAASRDHSPSSSLSSTADRPLLLPQSTSLCFLFPRLFLVVTPDLLLKPDVALRARPARINNKWNKPQTVVGWEKGQRDAEDEVEYAYSESKSLSASASAARRQSIAHAALFPVVLGGVNDEFDHSPLDFRPCLRESAVTSTRDYVDVEKDLYRRKRAKDIENGIKSGVIPTSSSTSSSIHRSSSPTSNRNIHDAFHPPTKPRHPITTSSSTISSSSTSSFASTYAVPATATSRLARRVESSLAAISFQAALERQTLDKIEKRQRASSSGRHADGEGRERAGAYEQDDIVYSPRHASAPSSSSLTSLSSALHRSGLSLHPSSNVASTSHNNHITNNNNDNNTKDQVLLDYLETELKRLSGAMASLEEGAAAAAVTQHIESSQNEHTDAADRARDHLASRPLRASLTSSSPPPPSSSSPSSSQHNVSSPSLSIVDNVPPSSIVEGSSIDNGNADVNHDDAAASTVGRDDLHSIIARRMEIMYGLEEKKKDDK